MGENMVSLHHRIKRLQKALKNSIVMLCALIVTFQTATAASSVAKPQGPLDIEADKVSSDLKTKVHHFQGHVRLTQADFQINAADLWVEGAAGKQIVRAKSGISGQVEVTWPAEHFKASASLVDYHQQSGEIILSGRVRLDQNGNLLESEKIRYILSSRTAIAEGALPTATTSSGRVKMRWQEGTKP
jgi:lipopolysaccharide transport protein LptA